MVAVNTIINVSPARIFCTSARIFAVIFRADLEAVLRRASDNNTIPLLEVVRYVRQACYYRKEQIQVQLRTFFLLEIRRRKMIRAFNRVQKNNAY
jgi:hypothetical protein